MLRLHLNVVLLQQPLINIDCSSLLLIANAAIPKAEVFLQKYLSSSLGVHGGLARSGEKARRQR